MASQGLNQHTAYKISPRAAVLWNGLSLEELGIANLLKSVDLTMTIGRTEASKKYPTGKPKVGGATVQFLLPTPEDAVRIERLLYLNPRPFLSIGFGFHGSTSYWVGGSRVHAVYDPKKVVKPRGYKIDNVTWSYPNGFPVLTLNGMTGQAIKLVENTKPKVWGGKTLAEISEGIALENGVMVRISGRLPANKRLENFVSPAGEPALYALERAGRLIGGVLDVDTRLEGETPGKTSAYSYVFDGASDNEDSWTETQEKIRTIISIKSVEEEFIDLDRMEWATTPKIVWNFAQRLTSTPFTTTRDDTANSPQVVFYADSVQITEDNIAKTYGSSAGVNKSGGLDGGAPPVAVVHQNDDVTASKPGYIQIIPESGKAVKPSSPTQRSHHITAAQETAGGAVVTEAMTLAALQAAGIKSKVSIQINTGAPELIAGTQFALDGTYTHRGLYGIEEVRNTWDTENGLRTSLVGRPTTSEGGSRTSRTKDGSGSTDVPVVIHDSSDVTKSLPGFIKIIAEPIKRFMEASEVPSAANASELNSEIDASFSE